MSYYLPSVDATAQHHWQRYNISLDEKALVEVRALLDAQATDQWSFRELYSSPNSRMSLDPVYVFFFKEPTDVVILHGFAHDYNYSGRSR